MDIKHSFDGDKGSFYYEEEGEQLAEMTYVKSGDRLVIFDHTEVSPVLKGQGVGRKLVEAGVQMAREKGWKVVPLCPFAKAEFDKHREYHDVLAG